MLNPEIRDDSTPPEPYDLKVPTGMVEPLLAKLNDMPVYAAAPVTQGMEHRVRKGETLSGIAARYRASSSAIMEANNLKKSNMLKVGMLLKIPSGVSPIAPDRPVVTAKSLDLEEYAVRKGDSLWQIASRANTTTKAIRSVNNLTSTRLSVGQVLRIPRSKTVEQNTKTTNYRVKRGDTPYIIAERYKMTLAEFLRINNLTSGCTIFPGQTLQVMVR
jgi:membrane-bound lytic murein transglycosylase D